MKSESKTPSPTWSDVKAKHASPAPYPQWHTGNTLPDPVT